MEVKKIGTEEAIEFLPHIANIIEKSDMINFVQKKKFKKIGQPEIAQIAIHAVKNIKDFKEDLYIVASKISETSIEEVKKQSIVKTISDVFTVFSEIDTKDFF